MNERDWTPGTFDIAMGTPENHGPRAPIDHRETVEGETWRSFGINAEDDGPYPTAWFVTHLPTGRLLVEAGSREAARRFCAEIAELTDWSTVRRCPPEIRDAALTAWHRAALGAMFTAPVMGCDAVRSEVDPRFDYPNWDTFDPPPGTWAPDCGHAACIEDHAHCVDPSGWHTYDCPVAQCRWDTVNATCDLDANHEGEHRWYIPEPEAPASAATARAGGR